jgi:chemotaxis protein methyltransferase CheR
MLRDPEIREVEALEIRLLLEAIYSRYGYDLREYDPTSIRRRVMAALVKSGLAHLGELQHKLLDEPEFFGHILEDLTIRVSELFRDPAFYRAFRTRVAPVLRTYPLLNIWHGGCATGEEPHSIAILLSEEGLYERCQIYATDLSLHALERARQGIYSAEHLDTLVSNYERSGGTGKLASYYTAAYDRIALKESLRRRILFFQHNLVSDQVFAEVQVIFCRNVLIYFGPGLRERVLDKLASSLSPGGFLCLGSSERLPPASPSARRFTEVAAKERIYRYEG